MTGIAWFVNDLLVSLDNYRGVFVGSILSLISAVAVMAPAQVLFGLNGPTVTALISNAICLIYQSFVLGKQTQEWFGERDRPMMSKAHALLKLQTLNWISFRLSLHSALSTASGGGLMAEHV